MATNDNILPAPYLLKLLYTLYDITIPKVILLCYLLQCCANMAEFSSTSQYVQCKHFKPLHSDSSVSMYS